MASSEEIFKKVVRTGLNKVREDFRFRFQQSDQFIVWIIGSDIAGIALLIGNTEKLNCVIGCFLKLIVVLLFLSIITGVIYKIISLPILSRWMNFETQLSGYLAEIDNSVLDDQESIEDIKQRFDEFVTKSLGLTDEQYRRMADTKNKVYPRGFIAGRFFKACIYIFLCALTILVLSYALSSDA